MLAGELHHLPRGRVSIVTFMAVAYLEAGTPSAASVEPRSAPYLLKNKTLDEQRVARLPGSRPYESFEIL
jgi:hypothetical protein